MADSYTQEESKALTKVTNMRDGYTQEAFKELPLYQAIKNRLVNSDDPNGVPQLLQNPDTNNPKACVILETGPQLSSKIGAQYKYKRTLLHEAIESYEEAKNFYNTYKSEKWRNDLYKNLEIIRLLLKAGVEANWLDRNEEYSTSLLHRTIEQGDNDLLEALLDSSPSIQVNILANPRYYLSTEGQWCREADSNLPPILYSPLQLALRCYQNDRFPGHKNAKLMIDLLLNKPDINLDVVGSTAKDAQLPLVEATKIGNTYPPTIEALELVLALLEAGAKPDIVFAAHPANCQFAPPLREQTLLMWALKAVAHSQDNTCKNTAEKIIDHILNHHPDAVKRNTSNQQAVNNALELASTRDIYSLSPTLNNGLTIQQIYISKLCKLGAVISPSASSNSATYLSNLKLDTLALKENEPIQKAKFQNGLQQYIYKMDRWYNHAWMHIKAFFGFGLNYDKYKLVQNTLKKLASASLPNAERPTDANDNLTVAIFENNFPEILKSFDEAHANTIIHQKDPKHTSGDSRLADPSNEAKMNTYKGRLGKLRKF